MKPFLTAPRQGVDIAKVAISILDGNSEPEPNRWQSPGDQFGSKLGCEVFLKYDGVKRSFSMRCSVRDSNHTMSENVSLEQVQEIVAKMVAMCLVQRVQED